jgi:hypothetical protein
MFCPRWLPGAPTSRPQPPREGGGTRGGGGAEVPLDSTNYTQTHTHRHTHTHTATEVNPTEKGWGRPTQEFNAFNRTNHVRFQPEATQPPPQHTRNTHATHHLCWFFVQPYLTDSNCVSHFYESCDCTLGPNRAWGPEHLLGTSARYLL